MQFLSISDMSPEMETFRRNYPSMQRLGLYWLVVPSHLALINLPCRSKEGKGKGNCYCCRTLQLYLCNNVSQLWQL